MLITLDYTLIHKTTLVSELEYKVYSNSGNGNQNTYS